MAASQLRIFSSADASAPQLTGQSGSLVNLLDAVLVNGYGSKTPLGWTKPLANDSLTSSLACWKQPSGSGLILYVNDAAPSGSTISSAREAWACGYEAIVGLTGSTYPTTGTGYGVFPHVSQMFVSLANGTVPSSSVWWRKSSNIDLVPRPWILYGDARTFYLFVMTGDTAGVYYTYWFGDIYSLRPTSDNYKCIIKGRIASQNNASTYRFDVGDVLVRPNSTSWAHFFAARSAGGGGFSTPLNVVGDQGKNTPQALSTPAGSSDNACEMAGIIPFPNPADMTILISPLFVSEQSNGMIRGRLRGLYHMCHSGANFTDGQEFEGANEFTGKRFRVIKTGPATFVNSSAWIVEISNTVETNPD